MKDRISNYITTNFEFIMIGVMVFVATILWIVITKVHNSYKAKKEWREKYKNFDYNYTEADKLNKKIFGDML